MSTPDLQTAIPATVTLLRDRGAAPTAAAVLESLGIELPPTLAASRAPAASAATEDPASSLGRFEVTGELGVGGMGRVLEARDPELGRTVAVKVVIDPREVTRVQLARFVAEAQITSQLEHPNIVPIYDMGVTDAGEVFFVMKKVEGRSLRQVLSALSRGEPESIARWPRTRLLHAFIQVCNAVAYANDRGVLHRDIKPSNVMLGEFGEVLLMDWGVARVMGKAPEAVRRVRVEKLEVTETMDGVAIGTPGFMSPEQATGELDKLDPRSDVWSLGAMLYELLTLQPVFEAPNVFALMYAVMNRRPCDPRERTPDRGIPAEIAGICTRALERERERRFSTARDLASAVEDFLDGSKRREAAQRHVAEGERAWEQYRALAEERGELVRSEQTLARGVDTWAPLAEKQELRQVRRRLQAIGPERVQRLTAVMTACDKAFSRDPGHPPARRLLAEVYFDRFEEAEAEGNGQDRLFFESRVREFDDDDRFGALLRGTGSITLRTEPAGAEVVCERYDTGEDLIWPLVERRVLGRTPLIDRPLEQGSYLLTIRGPGLRETRYPVLIGRGRRWSSGEHPLPLYSDAAIGPGLVYVPAGPYTEGGDPDAQDPFPRSEPWVDGFLMATLPVTMQEYCDFINALAARDPEEAWSRVPRQESGRTSSGGQYWARPAPGAPFVVPSVDRDGDRWDPAWPVSGVSWEDARAYVAWRRERDGEPWMLPTEQQWEKAGRGVDGRVFPWGSGFDATLCKMRGSRPGRPQPEPAGAFPSDVSPYGVRDLAGGIRDWCGDTHHGGNPNRRPVRGGAWLSSPRHCRMAYRVGLEPWFVCGYHGFRLARPLPGAVGPLGG